MCFNLSSRLASFPEITHSHSSTERECTFFESSSDFRLVKVLRHLQKNTVNSQRMQKDHETNMDRARARAADASAVDGGTAAVVFDS